jgi:DNA (cytosine-5)-methyltransferase 1
MRYFSCFSGIEAASVAWEPLGWTPVGFSEIDPFASAVLAHRFPNVRNYGDITKHHEWDIGRGSVDVLVGGSPCQAFSVAGLRKGLDDPRGQLTLVYLQLAARLEPEWIVWENVPGVLSADGGRAFGAFLGGLAELGYGFAWRVLDARFFGVPQRRRRVFLVARRAGDWQRPGEVLLEPAGLCWNPAESGEARQEIARAASDGARASGIVYGGSDQRYSDTVTSKWAKQSGGPAGNETGLFVAHPDVPDVMSTLDGQSGGQSLCNQFVDSGCCIPGEVKPIAFGQGSFAQYVEGECSTLRAAGGDLGGGSENIVVQPTAIQGNLIGRDQGGPQGVGCSDSGTMYTLTRGDVHGVAIPIQDGREIEKAQNGFGVGDAGDPAYTLDTTGAQSIAFSQNQREEVRILGDCAGALSGPGTHQATYVAQAADVRTGRLVGEISGTICAKGSGGWSNHMINPVLVPHAFYSTGGTHGLESGGGGNNKPAVATAMVVRRLLPVECERLQGFPDGWTDVPYRGKPAPDGPRYKALGNSMAVPCMAWIGRRIQFAKESEQ